MRLTGIAWDGEHEGTRTPLINSLYYIYGGFSINLYLKKYIIPQYEFFLYR